MVRRCKFNADDKDLIIFMVFSIFGRAHGKNLCLVAKLDGAPGLTQGEELTCPLASCIPQEKLLFLPTPVV